MKLQPVNFDVTPYHVGVELFNKKSKVHCLVFMGFLVLPINKGDIYFKVTTSKSPFDQFSNNKLIISAE